VVADVVMVFIVAIPEGKFMKLKEIMNIWIYLLHELPVQNVCIGQLFKYKGNFKIYKLIIYIITWWLNNLVEKNKSKLDNS
jgi:hypothetical protein